ncbi:uncharacterized protein [Palaemon carinicauda]|uniref:uncharacterized protein isoform X2 n=1 Tax=Palaemon carinicauda TaxID=392227 RepID=UPI0035B6493C
MDGSKEHWLMKRKPLFARRSCIPDINPLKLSNALNVEAQHDNVPYNLRSRVRYMKDVESQNSLSCRKVKDYYHSSVLPERDQENHNGIFHSVSSRLPQKENFSNNSFEPDYTFKEQPVPLNVPASTEKGSAVKLPQTLGRPAMLRKRIDLGEMRTMLAKLRKNQTSVFTPKEFVQNNKSYSRSAAENAPHIGFSRQTLKQNLGTNDPGNWNLGVNSTSKEYSVEEDASDSDCNPGSFKECRRALCFDRFQESQDNEDQTAPLEMIDITSVLPNALGQQDSPTKQKKYPFQGVSIRDRKDEIEKLILQDKTNVRKDHHNYFQNAKSNIPNKYENKPSFPSRVAQPKIIVTRPEVTARKTPAGKARVVKRRSVIPLTKSIPKCKAKDKLSYSTSKLTRFSENKHSQIKSVKKTQKVRGQSNIKKSRQSLILDVPKVEVTPEPVVIEEKPKPVELCHASTNTGILFSFGKSPNRGLVREVDVLMEEQEELTRKAQMILDETLERRRKMKSGNLLESFKTSISPLKRLCGMIQDKSSFLDISSSISESVKASEADTFNGALCEKNSSCLENSNMDISVDTSLQNESLGCSILSNTGDFNSGPMKWKHLKLNSRILQHHPPANLQTEEQNMSPVTDEEQFVEVEKDISPFTEMAGCCERPSLAPMTPHSHHQVSVLKLSLRKQLNQLYES